jgi:hypothetical protein
MIKRQGQGLPGAPLPYEELPSLGVVFVWFNHVRCGTLWRVRRAHLTLCHYGKSIRFDEGGRSVSRES